LRTLRRKGGEPSVLRKIDCESFRKMPHVERIAGSSRGLGRERRGKDRNEGIAEKEGFL